MEARTIEKVTAQNTTEKKFEIPHLDFLRDKTAKLLFDYKEKKSNKTNIDRENDILFIKALLDDVEKNKKEFAKSRDRKNIIAGAYFLILKKIDHTYVSYFPTLFVKCQSDEPGHIYGGSSLVQIIKDIFNIKSKVSSLTMPEIKRYLSDLWEYISSHKDNITLPSHLTVDILQQQLKNIGFTPEEKVIKKLEM